MHRFLLGRLLLRLAYPFCRFILRVFRWHDKSILPFAFWTRLVGWETLGCCLWYPHLFEPDYRFRMFGSPLDRIPDGVLISGTNYRVQVSDGLVIFSQRDSAFGHHCRICFQRDTDGALWYLLFSDTFDECPVTHIIQAFKYVEEVYGGDFIRKREVKPIAVTEAAS